MSRVVRVMEWARECERPRCIPQAKRVRGTKALGLSYERKFAKALCLRYPGARHGQWYEFSADAEHGYCQPDVVLDRGNGIWVFECKLTDVEQAQEQLNGLYEPVLQECYGLPVHKVVVLKSLSRVRTPLRVLPSVTEAILASCGSWPVVLHWLGTGPL